ncbi:MAG: isocitrate dehydrogenase, partial [Polaribacter sp.]
MMENTQVKQKSENKIDSNITKVAVAYGDGIGPEIMHATLRILEAAGANIEAEKIEV